ncbi:MAG: DHH family phosphoesterase [Nanoarchaeota archaeon]|nr:DHH family phosphoesterase [Nanoarchaeota archaeon]
MSKEVKELFSSEINVKISELAEEFLKTQKTKDVQIISHFDTDGITSASIIIKCLKRLDRKFSTLIVKNLTPEIISKLPKNKILFFLDLASNSLSYLSGLNQRVFIIDHHEITQDIPHNVCIANPVLHEKKEEISTSGLCYLFAKKIDQQNKDLASLAVIGMIGDSIENIGVCNNEITKDSDAVIKKGVRLYPSTRPLNRVLEFSSEPYIPTVTGNREGVFQLLKEVGLERHNGQYKSLIELNEEEMTRIVTAILLKRLEKNNENLIGNIFLVKHFNQLEDAREISAKINASSRLGEPYTAILYCLEESKAKKQIEKLYAKYKQMIIKGLNTVENIEKIRGSGYVIINVKSEISEDVISVVTTILSKSSLYSEGTVIIAMSHTNKGEVKVSARTVNRGRDVREIIGKTVSEIGGEFGGHKYAAGAIFNLDKESEFLEKLKKHLEIELVKI